MIISANWDNLAIALALVAVLLRLADRPRAATISSSLSILAATVASKLSRRAARRRRAA